MPLPKLFSLAKYIIKHSALPRPNHNNSFNLLVLDVHYVYTLAYFFDEYWVWASHLLTALMLTRKRNGLEIEPKLEFIKEKILKLFFLVDSVFEIVGSHSFFFVVSEFSCFFFLNLNFFLVESVFPYFFS